jgi:hypothetical protein
VFEKVRQVGGCKTDGKAGAIKSTHKLTWAGSTHLTYFKNFVEFSVVWYVHEKMHKAIL